MSEQYLTISNKPIIYKTAVLSPAGDPTKDYGKLCRIRFNAQSDAVQARIVIGDRTGGTYAVYALSFRQLLALGNNPEGIIRCSEIDQTYASGVITPILTPGSVFAYYNSQATYSDIDIYAASLNYDTRTYYYYIDVVNTTASAVFTKFNAETPIAALAWNATSQAAAGVIVYDANLTLNGTFTSGVAHVIATRMAAGYLVNVNITSQAAHASSDAPITTGLIPAAYRPAVVHHDSSGESGVNEQGLIIDTTGTIRVVYAAARTSMFAAIGTAYYIAD